MNICVFCSCSEVGEPYESAVRELGRVLGSGGNTLVFGGFDDGLMGAVADGFADADAPIVGVVPHGLLEAGRPVHPGCSEVVRTSGLTERKAVMIERADAFVAAPGGIGTLDELFSILGMVVAGETAKPVVAYDQDGFYRGLRDLLVNMEHNGFIRDRLDDLLGFADTPQQVLALCLRAAPKTTK